MIFGVEDQRLLTHHMTATMGNVRHDKTFSTSFKPPWNIAGM